MSTLRANNMNDFLSSITDPQFSLDLDEKENPREKSAHYQLCHDTAVWALKKKGDIALWEYDGGSREKPDVLLFHGHTSHLYEIKMSRSDFRADRHKWARIKWKPKGWVSWHRKDDQKEMKMYWKAMSPELYYIEHPHLGMYRYFVCPSGLLKPEEIPDGWGLYWVKNGRYYKKKSSEKFRRNLFQENLLLAHALRKAYSNGGSVKNVAYKDYESGEIK